VISVKTTKAVLQVMLVFYINVIISTKSLPGYLMQREHQNLCRRTACVVYSPVTS